MQIELLHDAELVKLDSLDRYIQTRRHFFRALAFGDQLQRLALSLSQGIQRILQLSLTRR